MIPRLALILLLIAPFAVKSQTKVEDLSSREQAAHLIGTCSKFIDYGNKRSAIRQTVLWGQYAIQINEMIGLLKQQGWSAKDAKIGAAAGRDILAKLVTDQISFSEDVYETCSRGLKKIISEQYQPNFSWSN